MRKCHPVYFTYSCINEMKSNCPSAELHRKKTPGKSLRSLLLLRARGQEAKNQATSRGFTISSDTPWVAPLIFNWRTGNNHSRHRASTKKVCEGKLFWTFVTNASLPVRNCCCVAAEMETEKDVDGGGWNVCGCVCVFAVLINQTLEKRFVSDIAVSLFVFWAAFNKHCFQKSQIIAMRHCRKMTLTWQRRDFWYQSTKFWWELFYYVLSVSLWY